MGVPVRSIKSFEEYIKYRSRKDWTLIIIANANSDSRAVEFVHNNFHIMDTISGDVEFFMPGYNVRTRNAFDKRHYIGYMGEQSYMDMEEREFADSHIQNFRYEKIYSPRIGSISFNEAEFADFILGLTKNKKEYVYLGSCQMVLIPITRDRAPEYSSALIFDLDKIIETPSGLSLDAFLHYSFQIIKEKPNLNRIERIFQHNYVMNNIRTRIERIFQYNYVMNKISEFYNNATSSGYNDDRYEKIAKKVVSDMERCVNWSLKEEFFFISYSSRNIMKATMLKNALQKAGLNVWIAPDGIPQGREYSLVIPTALRYAKHFILLLTKDSAASRWVKRELDIAINNEANTKIKVLMADNYNIEDMKKDDELMFYLNKIQLKYNFDDVINKQSYLERFIHE